MTKVKFGHGIMWVGATNGDRKNVTDLQDALSKQADCGPCGCNDCYGYTTQINAETGELMMLWISGTGGEGDGFVLNIDTYDAGLATVKALYAARQ